MFQNLCLRDKKLKLTQRKDIQKSIDDCQEPGCITWHNYYSSPATFQAEVLVENFPSRRLRRSLPLTSMQREAINELEAFGEDQLNLPVQQPQPVQQAPVQQPTSAQKQSNQNTRVDTSPVLDKNVLQTTFLRIFDKLYFYGKLSSWVKVIYQYVDEHNEKNKFGRTTFTPGQPPTATVEIWQFHENPIPDKRSSTRAVLTRTAGDDIGILWHELLHAYLLGFSCKGCSSEFRQLALPDGHGLAHLFAATVAEEDSFLSARKLKTPHIWHLLRAYSAKNISEATMFEEVKKSKCFKQKDEEINAQISAYLSYTSKPSQSNVGTSSSPTDPSKDGGAGDDTVVVSSCFSCSSKPLLSRNKHCNYMAPTQLPTQEPTIPRKLPDQSLLRRSTRKPNSTESTSRSQPVEQSLLRRRSTSGPSSIHSSSKTPSTKTSRSRRSSGSNIDLRGGSAPVAWRGAF